MMRNRRISVRKFFFAFTLLAAVLALAIASPLLAHAAPSYVGSGNGQQKTVSVVVTFYGYNDNSGQTENQYGSADIAYPKSDGYPTLHNLATEGSGTYNDPVTFAVRTDDQATFPIGSVAYFPLVHKYFIMEDECGDNDPQGCLNGTHHTDLWFGPQSASDSTALGDCEDNSTPGSSVVAVINPPSTFPVDTTKMFQNNQCTIHLYDGNTVPSSGATPTPTPTSDSTSCGNFSGTFHIINRNSGKYLDVQSDSTADSAGIVQYSSNGRSDQEWTFADAGSGYCKIINVNSGKLLNIPGPTTTKGTQLIQYHDDGGSNSQWQLNASGGYYTIVSRYDGQYIDVKNDSTSNNAAIVQWTSNGQADQQWQIVAG